MASERTNTDVVQVAPPAFLAGLKADDSLLALQEYRVLPRIRVVQAMSPPEIKSLFPEGTVILHPTRDRVADYGKPFGIVPVLFWTEFIQWRDINDKSGFGIVARSLDKLSPIAIASRDPERREEQYRPEGSKKDFKYRFCEHLNFAVVFYDPESPLHGQPAVVSFARGEFRAGRNFASAIAMRRVSGQTPPLWSQVWNLQTATRTNNSNQSWYGLDHANPSNPWIAESDVAPMQSLHEDLKKLMLKDALGVDRTDADADEAPVVDPEM